MGLLKGFLRTYEEQKARQAVRELTRVLDHALDGKESAEARDWGRSCSLVDGRGEI